MKSPKYDGLGWGGTNISKKSTLFGIKWPERIKNLEINVIIKVIILLMMIASHHLTDASLHMKPD